MDGRGGADGASGLCAGNAGGGGGAGGGAYFEADAVNLDSLTFVIHANGGDGALGTNYDGGGGGGGRVFFRLHDTSASAATNAQNLATTLELLATVNPGTNGSGAGYRGTVGVLLDFADVDRTNDHLYGVGGWRHEGPDGPHTFAVYNMTLANPLIRDGGGPVTISTQQCLLSNVTWSNDDDITVSTELLSVSDSTLTTPAFVDIRTEQFGRP
jgi:hypothetical protein